jgi:cobalt-zinc-cadmium efflux system protein
MVVEWVVGALSGSLALVADAGHMLADAGALFIALVAQRIAASPRTARRTYGARRAEVIAAFANGVALALTAAFIFAEAIARWRTSSHVAGAPMLVTATVGLGVNLAVARALSHGGAHGHNPNVRAALAHVVSDALGSVGTIVAGIIVVATGASGADTVVGIAIAVLVLASAWKLVRDTTRVLMEGTPAGLDPALLEAAIREVLGVADVHDVHAWTISSGFDVVTAHVVLAAGHHGVEVAERVAAAVRAKFGIDHVTVQPEAPPSPLVQVRTSPRPV